MYIMYISLWISYTYKMERINGARIDLQRLSNEELENLKGHVLARLDEVMDDFNLVMEELTKRSPQEWQDPLDNFPDQLDSEVQETVSSE